MARYTGPVTRKSRRLRTDLVGGDQAFEKRPYPPGQHGRARIKESEYLLQLQEKQKARFTYGVMEKQFRRYYEEAVRQPGKTGEELLKILESRLDNVIYRAGLARTRRMARQLVSHGQSGTAPCSGTCPARRRCRTATPGNWGQRRCHRDHPESQEPGGVLGGGRAGHHVPTQAGSG